MPNNFKRVTHGFLLLPRVKEGGGYFFDGLKPIFFISAKI
jgi:hypothetical protein